MDSKQSEFCDIVYEIFEFMGETLELPINRFKNTKNGVFKMGLLAFVVTVILDYYSSFDISSFIRRNYLVGYVYFAIRSVFIFLFAILKFKITYRIANIFFDKDDWRQDEKYNVLLLVMLQAAISMAIYPFGVYIVIVESFVILMFFIGLNIIHVTLHWIEICKTFHLQHSSRLDRSDKYCFLITPTLTNVGVF